MTFIPNWSRKIILKLLFFDLKRKINKQMKLEIKNALPQEKRMIIEKYKAKRKQLKKEFNINSNFDDEDLNLL